MSSTDEKCKALPRWLKPGILEAFEERKLAPYRTMTPEEKAKELEMLCETALELVGCRPDGPSILRFQAPVAEGTRQLWQRLRAGYRWHGAQR